MVAVVQIKRTSTPNSPPAGTLQPGELAIEMATPTRLWVGVPNAIDPALQKLLYDSSATSMPEPIGAGTWGRLETSAWQRSVALSGDVMTGTLGVTDAVGVTASSAAADAVLALSRQAGRAAFLTAYTGALSRWQLSFADLSAETGANAGSNFKLDRFDDLGALIDTPINISRASGVVDFAFTPTVGGVPIGGPNAADFVLKAGDTMTGGLTNQVFFSVVVPPATDAGVFLTRDAGQNANIGSYTTGGGSRWNLFLGDATAESGANAGSDVRFHAYDDAGAYLRTPLTIYRASGVVDFSVPPTIGGAVAPWVLRAGDTMTGNLQTPNLYALSPSMAWGNQGSILWGAHATAYWTLYTGPNGVAYVGQADGGGGFVVPWEWSSGVNTSLVPLVSNNRVQGNLGVWYDATGQFQSYSDGANRLHMDGIGWYYAWTIANGMRSWNGGGTMSHDGGGNFYAAGQVQSGGRVHSGTDMMNVNGLTMVANNPAYYHGRASWDGTWYHAMDNNVALLYSSVAGDLYVTRDVYCSAAVHWSGSHSAEIYAIWDSAVWRTQGNPATEPFAQIGQQGWGAPLAIWSVSVYWGGGVWSVDNVGNTVQLNACYATAYPGPSDINLKQNIVPWTKGLDVIRQINTVEYEFTPESNMNIDRRGQKNYGVNAQDIQAILPEAIHIMKRYTTPVLSREELLAAGGAPEVTWDEVLAVDANTIFYVMLNAVKEIAARLDAAGI